MKALYKEAISETIVYYWCNRFKDEHWKVEDHRGVTTFQDIKQKNELR